MPNKKNIEEVKELSKKLSQATAVYFTEYHGLSVSDMTRLRSEFFKVKVDYRVAKNTLIKLAAKENEIGGIDGLLKGSTAMAISYDEPVSPARVIKEFNKNNDLPMVKGILFEGEFMPGNQFSRLADLPSKDELLGELVGLLNSPMQRFVSTLNTPVQNLLGVLSNLNEKKS